jgi:hypothetical protein
MRLPPTALGAAIVVALAARGAAAAALQLSSPRAVNLPGITVDHENFDNPAIRGADVDPVTGHLWLTGEFLQADPLDPEEARRVDVVEYDPATKTTVSAYNAGLTGAFHNGVTLSLAVHPTTRNLFIGWFKQVDSQPDHGGFSEFTQGGALLSNEDLGGNYYASGAAFNPAGKLVLIHTGGGIDVTNPATRVIESTGFVHDAFPGQNYASADFDPLTGHLVLSGTNTGIVEFDATTLAVLSSVDDTPFLPAPGFLQPTHGRVQALAFSRSGDQLYLGGDFGLIVLDRAVPEPCGVVTLLACLLPVMTRRSRRAGSTAAGAL